MSEAEALAAPPRALGLLTQGPQGARPPPAHAAWQREAGIADSDTGHCLIGHLKMPGFASVKIEWVELLQLLNLCGLQLRASEPKFRCNFLLSHLLVVGMAAGACPTVHQALGWAWGHKGRQDRVSVLMELRLVGRGGERGQSGPDQAGPVRKSFPESRATVTIALAVCCTTYTCTVQ